MIKNLQFRHILKTKLVMTIQIIKFQNFKDLYVAQKWLKFFKICN